MMPAQTFALVLQPAPSPPAPSSGTGSGSSGGLASSPLGNPMVMIGLMFVVVYFMMIRPQQKRQREQQDWLKSLSKGDDVVTSGGIIGKIHGLTENTVTLETGDKVNIKILRSHIAGKAPAPGQPGPAPSETKPDEKN